MADDAAIARHYADRHATEPIPDVGPVTKYYGKGSTETYAFAWCPTCRDVWLTLTMHAHGLREPADKWAEMKIASARAMGEAQRRAVAYRERRIAEAERGATD